VQLKEQLKTLQERYHHVDRLQHDPVGVVHRYDQLQDQEIAAWIASGLAFGRVSAFLPVIDAILRVADQHGGPHRWLSTGDNIASQASLESLQYRWIRGCDIVEWLTIIRRIYRSHDTLGSLFVMREDEPQIGPALTRLVAVIREHTSGPPEDMTRGIRFLTPSPTTGSACKRWCMFLRWMVRPADGIDLGLWPHVHPSALVMPVDTHVFRIAKALGLTTRRQADWRAALEITARMRELYPQDPVRYDFALAHVGISGDGLQTLNSPQGAP